MACSGVDVGLFKEPISLEEKLKQLMKECSALGAGALVVFTGFVKGIVDGKRVYELYYEVYEQHAVKVMKEIAMDILNKYGGVLTIHVYHRVGEAKPGESTIYVIVVAKSRKEAFNAAIEVLERVKHEPPIYKLEKREDGEYWVLGDGTRISRSSRESS